MKINNNIIIDGTIQHEDGGLSNEVWTTDGNRITIPSGGVVFVADVASLPGTGTVDVLYIAKAENTLHEWNGSTYDALGSSNVNQENVLKTYNIDSSNLSTVDLAGVASYINTNGLTIGETELYLVDVTEPANVEPSKTVSTTAPTGTPNDGDEWVIYIE
jgi:hypothetical protein